MLRKIKQTAKNINRKVFEFTFKAKNFEYNRHFSFVQYIDIANRYNRSIDNFVCKLNVLLPLVRMKLLQNTANVISWLRYVLLNTKISIQSSILNTKIITNKAGNCVINYIL